MMNFKGLGAAAMVFATCMTGSAMAATCNSLDASASYGSFGSCTVTGGGPAGQDNFSNVNAIVMALFADEGISINQTGSFSPGPGTGAEFFGDRAADGFDITPEAVGGSVSFTFASLPTGTIFVSIKQGNGFELFGVPGGGLPFTLTHSLGGGSTSHISTFAGTLPPAAPIPLPAAGWMLLAGIGGLAAWGRRRSS